MSIDIPIAIVAHTTRLDQATRLAKTVDADYMTVDNGRLGCRNNHLQAWNWHRTQHSAWAVVLEDDAQPINNFRNQLEQALLAAPTPIVSLYLGRGRPQQFQQPIHEALHLAHLTGAHWITARHCIHAVGIAITTPLVPDMLTDLSTPRLHSPPIDEAITHWAHQRQHGIAYTRPSLLDHDDTLPVLAKHDGPRPPGRTAWQTGHHDEWNSDFVPL